MYVLCIFKHRDAELLPARGFLCTYICGHSFLPSEHHDAELLSARVSLCTYVCVFFLPLVMQSYFRRGFLCVCCFPSITMMQGYLLSALVSLCVHVFPSNTMMQSCLLSALVSLYMCVFVCFSFNHRYAEQLAGFFVYVCISSL